MNNFERGVSCATDSYNNSILSKNTDFKCVDIELWAVID